MAKESAKEKNNATKAAKTNKKTENGSHAEHETQPLFQLVTQYARDISVECAIPAHMLKAETDVSLDVGLAARHLGDDVHEVLLKLRCDGKETENDKTAFIVEVEFVGEYRIKNIPVEQVRALIGIDGAALIFPFARQVVMDSIIAMGHRPRLIEPVNFAALYMQVQQQAEGAVAN